MLKIFYYEILRCSVMAASALFLLAGLPAFAREELILYSDHSKLITLPRLPGTVVVGNPSIADVTLDGDRLLLHGRNFGNTSLTILDQTGAMMRDYEINVTLLETNSAMVFKNGARVSYTCTPNCQPTLTVGDLYTPHFDDLADAINEKTEIASGQPSTGAPRNQVVLPAPLTE